MKPKDEFINALRHNKIKESVPLWELEFHLWDKFNLGKFTIGTEFANLSEKKKEYALCENSETIANVCDLLHFSAITIPGSYWETAPGVPAFYWLPDEYRIKQTLLLKKEIGDTIALVANVGGIMAMPEGNNYMDFSIRLLEAPEEIDRIAEKLYKESLFRIDLFTDSGADVLLTASDLADNHGMYFSPEQTDRFIFPYLSKWVDYIKRKGLYSILHTDGNINTALNGIIECGVDGLQALDPNAKMDILKIQSNHADKLCVCENIDCGIMIGSSPDVIYIETERILSSAIEKGSFVFGASNALEYDTPVENYIALVNASEKYGKKEKP